MRKVISGKLILVLCLFCWALMVRILTGCAVQKSSLDKVRDLDFTVVGGMDVPEELQNILNEKRMQPFKLTYSNDQGLYIAVGYGEQATGGYSISVKELYLTDNAIVVDTELMGPESSTPAGAEKSYPYIIIKTEYLENPVIFQ